MAREILYPYDERGNLMHYADTRATSYSSYRAAEWRPGEEFTALLNMDHSISGMSAKYFMWRADDGHIYPMFAADLVDLAKSGHINHGKSYAVWTPRKRGQNFGIRFVREVLVG